jgi:hypothetical protein
MYQDPDSDPNPDPDPFVRGMDPRIRIHTKMSWISNTDIYYHDRIGEQPEIHTVYRDCPSFLCCKLPVRALGIAHYQG